jgi:hypothetical protein
VPPVDDVDSALKEAIRRSLQDLKDKKDAAAGVVQKQQPTQPQTNIVAEASSDKSKTAKVEGAVAQLKALCRQRRFG